MADKRARSLIDTLGAHTGRGLFAAEVVKRFPLLPVEEEGSLADPGLRKNFVERVFNYARIRSEPADRPGAVI